MMNWFDIVIIVLIAIPTLTGLRTGLIKAALTLTGLIIGIILAGRFYVTLAEQLTFIPQSSLARITAFAIILVVVMIITGVSASVLKWLTSRVTLGWVNRLGGAVFGLVMGAIFCAALLATWVKFLGPSGPVAESALAILLLDRFPMILALLPEEFNSIRSFFH
ncbi:MAG: CvpA family protein [Dehalococcoidales bacterium]|jgi:membrane protein required for colicin V production|nr:CvpA family protein [Dehalococcoidales bacterium]|tara:strand:+ start:1334 stop:1825 length:492 start_codon:yes stop_codon:yes gene_type:complete